MGSHKHKDRKEHKKKDKHKEHRKRDRHESSGSDSEERSSKKRKHSKETEAREATVPSVKLTEDDYFVRVDEFSVWLLDHRRKRFEELSSKDAHKQFAKFCKEWNAGKLEPTYYSGAIPEDKVAAAKKTQHSWGFVKRMTDRDKSTLKAATNSIKTDTAITKASAGGSTACAASHATNMVRPSVAPRGGGEGDTGGSRGHGRGGGLKAVHAAALDEIAPKETGRQAAIDKRRTVGAAMHGAAREREFQRDGLDLPEQDTMGGGGADDFNSFTMEGKEDGVVALGVAAQMSQLSFSILLRVRGCGGIAALELQLVSLLLQVLLLPFVCQRRLTLRNPVALAP
ncbi:hypothetical protein JKP88DRAFT_353648 [Tribonema minus]|uniref:Uncharacterized protein n=1 Tax=Tribonema minus TaxID=303371 RepID=A0A836CIB7_9STRA|nr:hypothetical protein JKP88DRAFT_353648 [Tribonema minus]